MKQHQNFITQFSTQLIFTQIKKSTQLESNLVENTKIPATRWKKSARVTWQNLRKYHLFTSTRLILQLVRLFSTQLNTRKYKLKSGLIWAQARTFLLMPKKQQKIRVAKAIFLSEFSMKSSQIRYQQPNLATLILILILV